MSRDLGGLLKLAHGKCLAGSKHMINVNSFCGHPFCRWVKSKQLHYTDNLFSKFQLPQLKTNLMMQAAINCGLLIVGFLWARLLQELAYIISFNTARGPDEGKQCKRQHQDLQVPGLAPNPASSTVCM